MAKLKRNKTIYVGGTGKNRNFLEYYTMCFEDFYYQIIGKVFFSIRINV